MKRPNILLFSTLNPYPFWAGSENLWFDFVRDERVSKRFDFKVMMADSPVTRSKVAVLNEAGATTGFYPHFNVSMLRRNLYRLSDKLTGRTIKTFPWFDKLKKEKCDLAWFNVAALADLADLSYAAQHCKQKSIPYWLILQHGYEDFFLSSPEELEKVKNVVLSARRVIFISRLNRVSLERAIGQRLTNAFHSVNALSNDKIQAAVKAAGSHQVNNEHTAKFFNLGRFSPRDKAQHLLLEALSADQWKDRNWQLTFIGVSGFGKDSLEKLVAYYQLDKNRIKVIPHSNNVLEEIVQHDVLLMPSRSEGTPFAMVESMACARPALGTPVGGIPELIFPEKTGWLVSSVETTDIRSKMEVCWQQRNQWVSFGKNAQEHICKEYNQENSFVPLMELLQQDAT